MLSVLALLGCGLASCVKEDFPDPDDVRFDPDGYSLGITIKLDDGLNTRAVQIDKFEEDEIDNYIDTRNRLRVLFFDENGQFIFEAVDRTVMERSATDGSEWFVHIPVNYVVDAQDWVYDVEALKKQLMEHDFKVAILANWEYRNADGEVTDRANAEPTWGYYNSILCTDASERDIKNINDLHHLVKDSIYATGSSQKPAEGSRPDANYVYGFLMKDGKMGIKSDWVDTIDNLDDKSAADYIKANWDPSKFNEKQFDFGYYRNMWYLWNFSAAHERSGNRFSDSKVRGNDQVNSVGWKWRNHNHYKKGDTDEAGVTHPDNSPLYEFVTTTPIPELKDNLDDAGLSFNPAEYLRTDKDNNNNSITINAPTIVYHSTNDAWEQYALRLGNLGGSNQSKDTPRGISFTASASGTLRVRAACSTSADSVRIAIYNKSNNESNSIAYVKGTTPKDITRTITINNDEVTYYIYCDRCNNSTSNVNAYADIFEIEYIKDKYLSDTNRAQVLPSKDHPIPMYGVQNFSKLENWKPGSTFDLSHDNRGEDGEGENGKHDDYEVKHISLIRALAKVVVYLPVLRNMGGEGAGAPTHIYMRSMNRTARCEPMDVETPTDQLWTDSHQAPSGNNKVYSDGICEWYLLKAHGSFYQGVPGDKDDTGDTKDSNTKILNYQQKLAWFYGSWMSAKWSDGKGWNFNGVDPTAQAADATKDSEGKYHYPHLFNPSINRSDFARMERTRVDNDTYRYVIYVPDKCIDDPNYVGISQSVTKVPHIEYRYNQNVMNVDDNNCYRIYFTDYSTNSTITSTSKGDFDNVYEMNSTNLEQHWPILRNHVYTFVVSGAVVPQTRGGSSVDMQMVSAQVSTYSGVPISVD